MQTLKEYLETDWKKLRTGQDFREPALFLGERGNRLCYQGLHRILKEQVKTSITPHQLRHAFATHMLQNGCGTMILQKWLGHSKAQTTQIYTHVNTNDVRGMLERFHPREGVL